MVSANINKNDKAVDSLVKQFTQLFLSFCKMKCMKFKVLSIYVCLSFLLIQIEMHAQSKTIKHSQRYYSKHPVWIEMMQNEQANYQETIKAFKAYWKDRSMPKEALDGENDGFEKSLGLEDQDKEEREHRKRSQPVVDYSAEVRAFKGWMQSNAAWVKSDGFLMTSQERQAIIDAQQKELKEIEIKNGKK